MQPQWPDAMPHYQMAQNDQISPDVDIQNDLEVLQVFESERMIVLITQHSSKELDSPQRSPAATKN